MGPRWWDLCGVDKMACRRYEWVTITVSYTPTRAGALPLQFLSGPHRPVCCCCDRMARPLRLLPAVNLTHGCLPLVGSAKSALGHPPLLLPAMRRQLGILCLFIRHEHDTLNPA